jgi:hypothetical protein
MRFRLRCESLELRQNPSSVMAALFEGPVLPDPTPDPNPPGEPPLPPSPQPQPDPYPPGPGGPALPDPHDPPSGSVYVG